MNNQQSTIDISKVSTKELQALLEQRKQAEETESREKRQAYESSRETTINNLGDEAEGLWTLLSDFKGRSMAILKGFRGTMLEYGDLHRGERNKGTFTLKNSRYKIEFSTQICKGFDERAELAEAKLREFMNTFLKKKADKRVVEMITTLLERGKNGDYDINLVNKLYAMKDRFNDANWRDGLELFQESYSPTGTAQYIRFSRCLDNGQWEAMVLDFAKLKTQPEAVTE